MVSWKGAILRSVIHRDNGIKVLGRALGRRSSAGVGFNAEPLLALRQIEKLA
jgi:hypothetical protein